MWPSLSVTSGRQVAGEAEDGVIMLTTTPPSQPKLRLYIHNNHSAAVSEEGRVRHQVTGRCNDLRGAFRIEMFPCDCCHCGTLTRSCCYKCDRMWRKVLTDRNIWFILDFKTDRMFVRTSQVTRNRQTFQMLMRSECNTSETWVAILTRSTSDQRPDRTQRDGWFLVTPAAGVSAGSTCQPTLTKG